MTERPPRLIRFLDATLDRLPGDRCQGRVRLQLPDEETVTASVEGGCEEVDALFLVAQAAAEAVLRAAATQEDVLEVTALEIGNILGEQAVFVSVTSRFRGENRRLMGFCSSGDDPHTAAALAVLNATNRFFNIG